MRTEMGILDPGINYTLRPMKYPQFFEYYKDAIKNTWTVDEISFVTDIADLRDKLTPAEQHVVNRLIAFFATGDNIVNDNLAFNLFKHVNSPEVRMYYSRQIYEESLHVQFYLTLLDNYLPDDQERFEAFDALNRIPSIKKKADFCFKWMNQMLKYDVIDTDEKKRQFILNLITFAAAVEGLFFFGAFAYVYYLRSKGLLHGLASGTNWVFRDESLHMNVAFEILKVIKQENPHLWDDQMEDDVRTMLIEAVECEYQFAEDVLDLGVGGLSKPDMKEYLQFHADQRLIRLGWKPIFNSRQPFAFMDLQDIQELTNFFERTVSQYQIGVSGSVSFDEDF